MTITMNISRLVALAGSLLTLIQILLIANDSKGICFNDGCEIVDSLTTVPPILFNVGGFLFFQAVFWGIWLAKNNGQRLQYVNILLLAGLAAEGVLVSFQYLVAQTFCSYCLIILSFIVTLNVLAGFRHLLHGGAVFAAVILGFSTLQFSGPQNNMLEELDRGSFAALSGPESNDKKYLFFSSTCKHCEKVIEGLQHENGCAIRFNPIDEITDFSLSRAQRTETYVTDVNRKFLKSMGLQQIPVLLSLNPSGFEIVKGEGQITAYLQNNCTIEQKSADSSGIGFSPAGESDFLPATGDDSCGIDIDCEDPAQPPSH